MIESDDKLTGNTGNSTDSERVRRQADFPGVPPGDKKSGK